MKQSDKLCVEIRGRIMTLDDNSSGKRLSLTESLLQQAADGRSPSSSGVYALDIDIPDAGFETHARLWLKHYESTPPYLGAIVDSSKCVYVGAARSVRDRLEDHIAKDVRKATLPTVYGINGLHGVWWYDSKEEAFSWEQSIRDELAEDNPTWFVHTR